MKQLLLIVLLVSVFCGATRAQVSAPSCPKIDVTGPGGSVLPGDSPAFSLEIEPPMAGDLKYHWSTSYGSIVAGQGTRTITVKSPSKDGFNLTVTVEIEGLPAGCVNTASETAGVSDGADSWSPLLIDEYGRMPFSKEKLHLDNVAHHLRNDREQRAVFVIYPQKNGQMSAIRKRTADIARYLKNQGVSKKKFTFVYGKPGTYQTNIWLVPDGGALPVPE